MKLTAKHQKFIDEYLTDFNGAQAAIRAGYSERSAKEEAYRLLKREDIQEALRERQNKSAIEAEITAAEITQGLKAIASNGEKDCDRVRALELLGKRIGYFERDKKDEPEAKAPHIVYFLPEKQPLRPAIDDREC